MECYEKPCVVKHCSASVAELVGEKPPAHIGQVDLTWGLKSGPATSGFVIYMQVFHNAPAVEAALKGRLLILEGVQKAGMKQPGVVWKGETTEHCMFRAARSD